MDVARRAVGGSPLLVNCIRFCPMRIELMSSSNLPVVRIGSKLSISEPSAMVNVPPLTGVSEVLPPVPALQETTVAAARDATSLRNHRGHKMPRCNIASLLYGAVIKSRQPACSTSYM